MVDSALALRRTSSYRATCPRSWTSEPNNLEQAYRGAHALVRLRRTVHNRHDSRMLVSRHHSLSVARRRHPTAQTVHCNARKKTSVHQDLCARGGVCADGGARDPSVLSCNRSSRTEARRGCSGLKSNGHEKGLVKEIAHDPGCGVLLVRAVFCDTYKFKLKKELFVAAEGTRTGQVWEILQPRFRRRRLSVNEACDKVTQHSCRNT